MEQKKKKGESISKQEYIKCYHSAESPTPDGETINEDTSKKEAQKKDLINKALEIALDTRKFEIELYWKRTAYFVLFIGAIFVGYYNVFSNSKSHWASLFIAALGFLLSLLWYMANRGSKFWQENWKAHIEELSTYLGTPIFGIIKSRKDPICKVMGHYPFSVSKVNQMVSLIITISWFLTFIKDSLIFNENDKQIIKKVIANCSFLDTILFFLQDNIFWRTIIGIIVIIMFSGLVICRLCKGFAAKELDKEDNINYFWNYSSELKLDNTSNDNDEDQN
ncbi:hypothetical protein [Prevotella nigrescens]|uniref:RipA family octameric membrane protein n=1 Tax=Prevotella nigrescens TaxID=28133 RepID=UPI0028E3657E|nr:hypothetical protein [Prevotella nigrescens]